jgi:coenzyme F420 hydrogenase subunit beta
MEEGLENFVPLIQKSRGYEELKKDVIDSGICSGCGACAAFCDRVQLTEDGSVPASDCNMLTGAVKCNVEGICYDCCPHVTYSISELEDGVFGNTREDGILGHHIKALAVRSKDKNILKNAQDGGAATSLLLAAVNEGFSDAAIVTTRDASWNVDATTSKDKKDIATGAGTKYARAPPILKLGENLRKTPRLAVVGTGCQIAGTRKLEKKFLSAVEKVELTLIGLFCYENFPYTSLKKIIEEGFGLKMEDVTKTDITKGKMHIWTKNGKKHEKPIKEFADHAPVACDICRDFTATFSDLTCGSIGSESGWTTVIVRSQRGLDLLEKAKEKGYIEVSSKVDLEEVKKTGGFKKKKREKTLEERKKEGLFNPDYS